MNDIATEYPVLSLWQPWASLVALGVKRIETRSWCAPKSIIGQRIAIHATRKGVPTYRGRFFDIGAFTVERDDPRGCAEPAYLLRGPIAWPYRLPLGAIVARARLTECAPMLDLLTGQPDSLLGQSPAVYVGPDTLTLSHHFEVPARHLDISDQRPYGDFAPGRWAWIIEDVEALPVPVPFKGGQGFSKRWTPGDQA